MTQSVTPITTQEGGQEFPLVPIHQEGGALWADARTLHAALRVGRDFSNWIKDRLEEIGAQEGAEFIALDNSPNLAKTSGGRPRRDYWLSLDLAKEVAMLERSEIGKTIRRYFIQAEKQLRASQGFALPATLSEALQLAADQARENERLTAQNALLAPKAEVYDALISADGTYAVGDAAKILGTGEIRLFQALRDRQILMDKARSGVEHHNLPYQQFIERGYFTVITRPRPNSETGRVTQTTRITAKGLAWLQRHMTQQGLLPLARGA